MPAGSRRSVRVGAALVALVLLAGGGALAWNAFGPQGTESPTVAAPGPGEVHRIRFPDAAQSIAFGEGAAWVYVGLEPEQAHIWRIDAETEGTTRLPDTQGTELPAAGEGFAWAACDANFPCGRNLLYKLDPDSGKRLATIPLPEQPGGS